PSCSPTTPRRACSTSSPPTRSRPAERWPGGALLACGHGRHPPHDANADQAPDLARTGGFRLDDPDGAVGLEFMVVTDAATGASYHVPLTYRDSELPGAGNGLIGTSQH